MGLIIRYKEAGFEEALLGMSLSFYDHAKDLDTWWDEEKYTKAYKRSKKLAFRGGGHNKFLESIQVWILIQAPRDFWSEFDTYRSGVSKQSASTMHTLDKRIAVKADFDPETTDVAIENLNALINAKASVSTIKKNLPEGWLQERMVSTNYKTLQNIVAQRHNHRLKQWPQFIEELLNWVHHPEYLTDIDSATQETK